MSNNPYENVVPTEDTQLPDTGPYSTTPMQTVVGVSQVANASYDVQGNAVSSEEDTPLDVNALHGVTVTSESLQAPSTGMVPESQS